MRVNSFLIRLGGLPTELPVDPGRGRLIKAVTASVSVGVGIAGMWALSPYFSHGGQMLVVAGFLALQAVLLVRDHNLAGRQITTALLILPALASGLMAAGSHAVPYGEDVLFVLVATIAVWVRRYGPRAGAMGMIGFFAYFFALLLRVDMAQFPAFATAVICGLGGTALVRTVLIREMPGRRLRRMRTELGTAAMGAVDIAWNAPRHVYRTAAWRRRMDRFSAVVSAVHAWQDEYVTARFTGVSEDELARAVFGVQTGVEELCARLWALPAGTAADPELVDVLDRIRARLGDSGAGTPGPYIGGGAVDDAASDEVDQSQVLAAAYETEEALAALATIPSYTLTQIHRGQRAERAAEHRGLARGVDLAGLCARLRPRRPQRLQWDADMRASVQTAAAAILATVVGHLISADRWYWAVLTGFMVFYNTASRGEILVRARRRIVGTAVGVGTALALVTMVGHQRPLEFVLLVICVFAVVYFGPLSYTVLTFFITLLLAWMYELMGILNLRILEWRVEETLAGAVIGIAAAFLIMPTHSTPIAAARMTTALDRLDELIGGSLAVLETGRGGGDVVASVRRFDQARDQAAAAAATLAGGLAPRRIRIGRRIQRDLRALGWAGHVVAHAAATVPVPGAVPTRADMATAGDWARRVEAAGAQYVAALRAETERVPHADRRALQRCGAADGGAHTAAPGTMNAGGPPYADAAAIGGERPIDQAIRAMGRIVAWLQR